MNAAPYDDCLEDLEKMFTAIITVYGNEPDCVAIAFNLLNMKRNRVRIRKYLPSRPTYHLAC
jgi:hypothetical protein